MPTSDFKWDSGNVEEIFDLKECLGEGTYGTVWTAIDTRDSEVCAVKIQSFEDEEDLDYLKLEIELMRRSQSPYTVKFIGSFKPPTKDDEVWIVMEHCLAGSLADLMNVCETTYEEEQIQQVAAAAALGIAKLHECLIIHRDIKAGNILLNSKGNVRITDLGVGADLKSLDERRDTLIGAPYWMAPEIMLEKGYDCRVDVWSLGITVIELADSVPPNAGVQGEDNILKLIPTQEPPTVRTPKNFSPEMNDFIAQCVTRPYQKRKMAKDLLNHPFIADTVKYLEAHKGRSKLLRDFVKENKSKILTYRKADESLFAGDAHQSVATDFVSRFSRVYNDQVMSREEAIRTSVLLPTQQGLHGEKVIGKEAQRLLTKEDVDFMVSNRELRESIKSGVVTPHLAKLLKERRDEDDSLFAEEEEQDTEDLKKREDESQELHNKLIYYYSKYMPSKLKDTQAIERLVEIGMQYGVDYVNEGLKSKYGESLPSELPAKTKQRKEKEAKLQQFESQKSAKTTFTQESSMSSENRTASRNIVPPAEAVKEEAKSKHATQKSLTEIPIPKSGGNTQGYIRSGETAHQSVRVLKDFGNVKKMFENGNQNQQGRKEVMNRNKGLWEMNVNKAPPPYNYANARKSRFIQPFPQRQGNKPGANKPGANKPGANKPVNYAGAKYSKWQITPMGYTNTNGKPPARSSARPGNFNQLQSWWERRNQTNQNHKKPVKKKNQQKNNIQRLL